MACVATSFTFDTDFFRDDCIARFIGLRSPANDEMSGTLAHLAEIEERLAAVTVSVMVDRSCRPDARNLRWDLIPVAVPGGLLHAKTALLIWDNVARVIIGSANLTPAGYRRQREIAVAFDLEPGTIVPRHFWVEYHSELLRLITLAPDDLNPEFGPKSRMESAAAAFDRVIDQVQPPGASPGFDLKLAPSRPGEPATRHLLRTVQGGKLRRLTATAPFWDGEDRGSGDAVRHLTSLLAASGPAKVRLGVPLETTPSGRLVNAPRDLTNRVSRANTEIELFGVTDQDAGDRRRLHAKVIALASDSWLAIMIGSSNPTVSGLGLSKTSGHVELNVAYGVPTKGQMAKSLAELIPDGEALEPDAEQFRVDPSPEDEPSVPVLPLAFRAATLDIVGGTWVLRLALHPSELPTTWSISLPTGPAPLIDSTTTTNLDVQLVLPLADQVVLPQFLTVRWSQAIDDLDSVADWVLNVADPGLLPLDERLRALPVDLLVRALAHRFADPARALQELLDLTEDCPDIIQVLDPLRRFDDSRALLRRVATYGYAIDRLGLHLARPAPTTTALRWRLNGLLSPTRLADGWVDQWKEGDLAAELAHFLIAELHLIVANAPWFDITARIPRRDSEPIVASSRAHLKAASARLPKLPRSSGLGRYARAAANAKERW